MMSNTAKTMTDCQNCKSPFRVSIGSTASICPDCLSRKKRTDIKKNETDLKKEIIFSQEIEFDLSERGQKLTAVRAQGEVFASKGGVDLMITEFVENSFDAIKKRKITEAFSKALKQMKFSSEFEQIAIDKYSIPITEFNEKYRKLKQEDIENFSKLQDKIIDVIKSEHQRTENIIIELDDEKQELRIIDSGTGIEYPAHICEHPFVSLKTGEDYSTGKFGRGSQVFREFCGLMQFYSIRENISEKELEMLKKKSIDHTKIDTKSIHIKFPWDFPGGVYSLFDSKTFKKLSNYNRIGTVVVLSDWKQNYYDDLSKHLSKLERRLVHHFGFAIKDVFNIGLKLKHKNKIIDICPKNYADDPKIQGLFNLPPYEIKSETGKSLGKVEFYIYKTVRSYSDPSHKEPFLIINGRPLGDASISEMPRLSQHKEIWQSNTITGYVVCNAVEPNQMRIGLANNEALTPFLHIMTAASIDLKRLNTIWKNELSSAVDKSMMNEVVDTVTRFLSKKGIKFNFKNPLEKGLQRDSKKQGEDIIDEKISTPGDYVKGHIEDSEGEDALVGYRKAKTKKITESEWDDDTIIVPSGDRKKEGGEIVNVKVKTSVVNRGGKKIRRSYSGPDLDFNADEDCGDELSYFESDPPTVMIQSEHMAWKRLSKKAKDQVNGEKYEKEKKNYLLERYLWELMNNDAVQTGDELTEDDRKNMFWTYYHDLTDTK